MRQLFCIWVSLTMVGAVQQEFVGTWTGTWDGAGTGGFELTREKGNDSGLTGRVSVTGEPTYKATLRTVSFTGTKMSAVDDFPPDDQIEVVLSATFEGDTAKGTWVARGKGGGADLANGTWTVARK